MHTIYKIGKSFSYMTPVSLTDRPILGMVTGAHKTLLIDAGNSEAHVNYFINELQKQGVPRPNIVVLTHWHWDHIFGLSALEDTVSIASKATEIEMRKLVPFSWSDEAIDARVKEGIEIEFCAKAIKEEYVDERNINIVLPDITFNNRLEINLGGVTCILQHVGGDHAADSVVVYVKEEKILFLADCIYPKMYAEKVHYTIEEIRELLNVLETFDAETYIPSHQQPISKQEFQEEAQKLRKIADYTELYKGSYTNVLNAYKKDVQRELNENEMETIENFVNGYEM